MSFLETCPRMTLVRKRIVFSKRGKGESDACPVYFRSDGFKMDKAWSRNQICEQSFRYIRERGPVRVDISIGSEHQSKCL